MKKSNLVLIPESSLCDIGDFHAIADIIRKQATDIRVHVIKRRKLWWRQFALLFSPSLYVAFYEAKCFSPIRGLCLHGQAMDKSEQYKRIENVGIKVIPWERVVPGKHYKSTDWGNPAIVKPDYGSEGRGVFLCRPEDVNFENMCADSQARLIQKFIVTGDNPTYFRALTLFGETLYLRRTSNSSSRLKELSGHELPCPVANAAHGCAELVNDPEVIEFARRVANLAFPTIPLLGQDIIREPVSGNLYCLEVNPYGSTWHFSTPAGRALQQREGFEYRSQFAAFELAARTLIDKTREFAS